jgi:hypothetical protein
MIQQEIRFTLPSPKKKKKKKSHSKPSKTGEGFSFHFLQGSLLPPSLNSLSGEMT